MAPTSNKLHLAMHRGFYFLSCPDCQCESKGKQYEHDYLFVCGCGMSKRIDTAALTPTKYR